MNDRVAAFLFYGGTVGPLVAGPIVLWLTSRALSWRLWLIVPLIGGAALLLPQVYQIANSPPPPGGRPLGLLYLYTSGLILYGPQATMLGEFGWLAARWLKLRAKCSLRALMIASSMMGMVIGPCFLLVYGAILNMGAPPGDAGPLWLNPWTYASMAGGAVGGVLVAYYAVKEFGRGPDRARTQLEETLGSGAAGAGV